jgi:alpha-beta hydrolase superfamily lysophospholipase
VREQAVELRAADGSALSGTWATPEGTGPWPSVACIHGLTLTRSIFDEAAGALAGQGVASLRLDLRGHGRSGGALKEQGFNDQVADVGAAFQGLAGLPGADPARRGLLGFSMGGAMGALVARSQPELKALALWSPLLKTGFWDAERRQQYGDPAEGYQAIWDGILVNRRLFTEALALDPDEAARDYPGPFFVCHGGKDRNHPQANSVALAAARQAAGRPVASYFPPQSGHRYHHAGERATRDALSAAFFKASL